MCVGIVGVFAFSGTGSGPASDLANDAKAAAANTVQAVREIAFMEKSPLLLQVRTAVFYRRAHSA